MNHEQLYDRIPGLSGDGGHGRRHQRALRGHAGRKFWKNSAAPSTPSWTAARTPTPTRQPGRRGNRRRQPDVRDGQGGDRLRREAHREAAAQALVTWSESYPQVLPRNAGPTTSYVINELKAGKDPIATRARGSFYGRGTSNGAAMRVAAAGLCRPGGLDYAVRTAVTMTAPPTAPSTPTPEPAVLRRVSPPPSAGQPLRRAQGLFLRRRGGRASAGPRPHRLRPPAAAQAAPGRQCASPPARWRRPGRKIEALIGNDGSIQPSVAAAVGLFAAAEATLPGPFWGAPISAAIPTPSPASRECWPGPTPAFPLCPRGWYATFRSANPTLDFESAAERLTVIAQNA